MCSWIVLTFTPYLRGRWTVCGVSFPYSVSWHIYMRRIMVCHRRGPRHRAFYCFTTRHKTQTATNCIDPFPFAPSALDFQPDLLSDVVLVLRWRWIQLKRIKTNSPVSNSPRNETIHNKKEEAGQMENDRQRLGNVRLIFKRCLPLLCAPNGAILKHPQHCNIRFAYFRDITVCIYVCLGVCVD